MLDLDALDGILIEDHPVGVTVVPAQRAAAPRPLPLPRSRRRVRAAVAAALASFAASFAMVFAGGMTMVGRAPEETPAPAAATPVPAPPVVAPPPHTWTVRFSGASDALVGAREWLAGCDGPIEVVGHEVPAGRRVEVTCPSRPAAPRPGVP